MTAPRFVELCVADATRLAQELTRGLTQANAQIEPKFFYDALGSRLFEAITELPEYTPTRTEAALFATHRVAIAAAVHEVVGADITLVDLGAGNGEKAERLFSDLTPTRYVAVDISIEFLRTTLMRMQQRHPEIEMLGVGLDFSHRLVLPTELIRGPALFFYPGSSISNFAPPEALRLLREMRAQADALLIGVDLIKPHALIEAAYDDALGVTAAFNLNVLRHVNRVLGADFDVRQWRHVAGFNHEASRIEMHLEARHALTVRWPEGARQFAQGERIHTENSYKWTCATFTALLHEAGFAQVRTWGTDATGFALLLASA